uniref:Uncharacterized protein n=1 Tax=Fagus sylvatica TaxID=28930 RepID=A0A2N9FBE0_FAGSY
MGNKIARTIQVSASEYNLHDLPSSYNLVLKEVLGRGRFFKCPRQGLFQARRFHRSQRVRAPPLPDQRDFPCGAGLWVWPFQIRVCGFSVQARCLAFPDSGRGGAGFLRRGGSGTRGFIAIPTSSDSSFSLYLLCLKPVSLPPPLPNLYLHRSSTLYPLPPPPPPPLPTTHTLKYNVEIKNYGKGIDDSGGSFAPAWWSTHLGQDHHAQGGSDAFSRIRRVGGGVSVADFANRVVPV